MHKRPVYFGLNKWLNVVFGIMNRKTHLLTSLVSQPHCVYIWAFANCTNQTFQLVDAKSHGKPSGGDVEVTLPSYSLFLS